MPFLDRVFRRVHDFTSDRDLGGADAIISADKMDREFDNVAAGLSELKVAAETDTAELRAETRDREAAITAERTAREEALALKANAASLGAHTGDKGNPHGVTAAQTGAATAAQGAIVASGGRLGPTAIEPPGGDWRNVTENGFYMSHTAANAPGGGWWIGQAVVHNGSWVTLTVWQFTADAPNSPRFVAHKLNGAWGGWHETHHTVSASDARYYQKGQADARFTTPAQVAGQASTARTGAVSDVRGGAPADRNTLLKLLDWANAGFADRFTKSASDGRYVQPTQSVQFSNVTIANDANYLHMRDTSTGQTRHVHHNEGNVGFLSAFGSWTLRVQDDGNIWSPLFGFLNEYITPKHLIVRDVRTVDAGVTQSAGDFAFPPRPGAGSFTSQAAIIKGATRLQAANRYVQKNVNGVWYTIGDA